MKKLFSSLLVLAAAALTFTAAQAMEPSRMSLSAGDEVFVCGCGTQCQCNSMSAKEGMCTCGKEMVKGTVMQIEEGSAMVKIGDREQSFKTVGKFACACGAMCKCNSVSQNPGDCVCGTPMAEVMKH